MLRELIRQGSLNALLFCAVAAVGAADPICLPERSVAGPGETVAVRLFDSNPSPDATYSWSASIGRVEGGGARVRWTLAGIVAGRSYSIHATVRNGRGQTECSAVVLARFGDRGDREVARAFLPRGEMEKAGFGAYSYFLLGSRPVGEAKERCLEALRAYLRLSQSLAELEQALKDPGQINANYLPVTTRPAASPPAEWVLENYDFARSRAILKMLPGSLLHGPYLLTLSAAADPRRGISGPYLVQDLSAVPKSLVGAWYEVFLNHATQARFWVSSRGEQFALNLRTMIAVLAQEVPDIRSALPAWIKWAN